MKLEQESVEPELWKAEAGVLSNGTGKADDDDDDDELLVGFDNAVVVEAGACALLRLFSPSSGVVASSFASRRSCSCSPTPLENPLIISSEEGGDGGWLRSIDNVGTRVEARCGTEAADANVVARHTTRKSAKRIWYNRSLGILALDRPVEAAIDGLSMVTTLISGLITASETTIALFVVLDRDALDIW